MKPLPGVRPGLPVGRPGGLTFSLRKLGVAKIPQELSLKSFAKARFEWTWVGGRLNAVAIAL